MTITEKTKHVVTVTITAIIAAIVLTVSGLIAKNRFFTPKTTIETEINVDVQPEVSENNDTQANTEVQPEVSENNDTQANTEVQSEVSEDNDAQVDTEVDEQSE